jgi:hypothetical protein
VVVLGEHREAVQHQHPQAVSSPTKISSENGVSVVAMCADSHLTGLSKTVLYSPAMGLVK